MNVNPLILNLKTVIDCPVVPDVYTGKSNKWIVFTYEDERSCLDGDNVSQFEQATIQITLYTDHGYNYMADKKKIKKYLVDNGFQIQSIQSWIENKTSAGQYIRHTVFTVYYVAINDILGGN